MNLRDILLNKNIKVSDSQLDKINEFMNLVIEENKKYNLTSILEEKDFFIKHILDSAIILNKTKWCGSIADVGSGAGFPGIILAILEPDLQISLIDSNNKKTTFMNLVIETLKLKNAVTINERAENINQTFDIVTSRATAPLGVLVEITTNLLNDKGRMIFLKGVNYKDEFNQSKMNWLEKNLGVKYNGIIKYNLDNDIKRVLILFEKTGNPKKGFPREYSQIRKEPII